MHLTGSAVLFNWPLAYHDHLSRLTLVNLSCGMRNSLCCLGPVNAGIFYAVIFTPTPNKTSNGDLLYQCIPLKPQPPEQQVLADDRVSFMDPGPSTVHTFTFFVVEGKELMTLLSWIKLIIWFVNALFGNIKFNIAPPERILLTQHLNLSKYSQTKSCYIEHSGLEN